MSVMAQEVLEWEPRSIEEREERISEIEARLNVLDEENADTRMTEEDRDEWNRLNAELDEQRATVKELRARKARLAANANVPAALAPVSGDVPALHRSRGADLYDLARIRAESRSDDDHRARLTDAAKRVVERSGFPSALVARMGTREDIQGHVEQLLDNNDDSSGTLARQVIATGSPAYDRAFGKIVMFGPHMLSGEEQRAMSVGGGSPVGSEGGLAVPFQLDPSVLLTSAGTLSPLRRISRVEQITSKTWQGITSAGITVSRSAEAAAAGDNSFTIAQPTVSPTRVIAEVPFSVEIDQDWPQLRGEIARLLADAKTVEEDTAFVTGDGTGVNPGGIPATLATGSTIADGNTFDRADLYGLEAALPVRFRNRARFMANKATYQSVRQLDTQGGADLWVRLAQAQGSELLGYPAEEASTMLSAGAAASNNRYLLFGDFSNFLIVDRLGTLVEINPHKVDTTNNRWTGQRALLAFWRNSSKILVDNAFRCLRRDT